VLFLFEVRDREPRRNIHPTYLYVIEYAHLFLLCGELSFLSEGYANYFIFPGFVFFMYNTEYISKVQDSRVKKARLNCLLQSCYMRVFY
jgi:hypothetical protein